MKFPKFLPSFEKIFKNCKYMCLLSKSINYITLVYNDLNFNEGNSLLLNLLCKFLKINTLTVLENKCYFLHFHKVHN